MLSLQEFSRETIVLGEGSTGTELRLRRSRGPGVFEGTLRGPFYVRNDWNFGIEVRVTCVAELE